MQRYILSLVMAIAICLTFGGQTATSAPVCVTETFAVPDGNGGCCNITVDYCSEIVGGVLILTIGTITVPSDCQLVVNPGLFNWLRKKIVYRLNAPGRLNLGIPNCPTTSTIIVQTSQSSCYSQVMAANGDKVYNPCGASTCTKRCAVCLSTSETDPCSDPANEPMLQYVGCQNTIVPCSPGPGSGNCTVNTCDSN